MSTSIDNVDKSACCITLESVNRIAKLPVVETTYQTGKNIYDKVKDYNTVTNWTISTAENTVCKAVEVGKPYAAPVVHSLEGPIKKVDGLICTGLDYMETKVPAMKLPPGEMYNSTKDYIASSPTVQSACAYVKPAVDTAKGLSDTALETAKSTVQGAKNIVEPAYEGAKHMVEPAVQSAKNIVEPYVQSSLEKAAALKEYGTHKVEEYLHATGAQEQEEDEERVECVDCKTNSQIH